MFMSHFFCLKNVCHKVFFKTCLVTSFTTCTVTIAAEIDWELHRGLRREAKIARNQRKPYSEQKMSYVIEIMFSKTGLVMKHI